MSLKQQGEDNPPKSTEGFFQKLTVAEAYIWAVVVVIAIILLAGRAIYLAAH
jgi:hypothetical protein